MRFPPQLRAIILAAITAGVLCFALAGTAGASSSPTVSYAPSTPSIGDRVTIRGTHFKARRKCSLKVNNVKYGSGRTSKKGRVRISFTVPKGAWQELAAELTCGGATASTTIVVVDGETNVNGADGIGNTGDGEFEIGEDPDGDGPAFEFSF